MWNTAPGKHLRVGKYFSAGSKRDRCNSQLGTVIQSVEASTANLQPKSIASCAVLRLDWRSP